MTWSFRSALTFLKLCCSHFSLTSLLSCSSLVERWRFQGWTEHQNFELCSRRGGLRNARRTSWRCSAQLNVSQFLRTLSRRKFRTSIVKKCCRKAMPQDARWLLEKELRSKLRLRIQIRANEMVLRSDFWEGHSQEKMPESRLPAGAVAVSIFLPLISAVVRSSTTRPLPSLKIAGWRQQGAWWAKVAEEASSWSKGSCSIRSYCLQHWPIHHLARSVTASWRDGRCPMRLVLRRTGEGPRCWGAECRITYSAAESSGPKPRTMCLGWIVRVWASKP